MIQITGVHARIYTFPDAKGGPSVTGLVVLRIECNDTSVLKRIKDHPIVKTEADSMGSVIVSANMDEWKVLVHSLLAVKKTRTMGKLLMHWFCTELVEEVEGYMSGLWQPV